MNKELNYNVSLFISHNMNIEHDILPVVIELENNLLSKYKDFKYEDIKNLIEEWSGDIDFKVKRKYTVPENDNIPILREKNIMKQEEAEAGIEKDEEKGVPSDDDVRKINNDVMKIGRLVDYMGNILKNYSGGMEDITREKMIDLMFKSALKTIGAFFGFSMYIVTKLINMLDEKIKEGNDKALETQKDFSSFVKSMFAEIWLQFVSSSILGLAASLECDALKMNIANYSMINHTDFIRMVYVEFLIRIANTHLPVSEINNLIKGKDSLEEISQVIMKKNIHRYLCSYQFNDNDRRTVCNILDFNMKDVLIEEHKNESLRNK